MLAHLQFKSMFCCGSSNIRVSEYTCGWTSRMLKCLRIYGSISKVTFVADRQIYTCGWASRMLKCLRIYGSQVSFVADRQIYSCGWASRMLKCLRIYRLFDDPQQNLLLNGRSASILTFY